MSLEIPKRFHRIWLGGKPMPELFQRWGESWTRLNPDWSMTTWTEENLPPTRFPDLVKQACHLSQRSNIYRYEILARYGGVYVDTDFECLKPIDPLLDDLSAFVCLKRDKRKRPGYRLLSAILGAVPGHPFIRRLVDGLPGRNPAKSLSMGSRYVTDCLDPSVKVLDSEVFDPLGCERARSHHSRGYPDAKQLFPDAYGVHYWTSLTIPLGFRRFQ